MAFTGKNTASGFAGLDGNTKLIASQIPFGTGINTVCQGNDSRLSSIGGGGGISAVGLSLPAIFTVLGSPLTSSGSISGTLNIVNSGLFLGGPSSNGSGVPLFRSLTNFDIPSGVSSVKIGSGLVSDAEFNCLDGVAGAIQDQINAKIANDDIRLSDPRNALPHILASPTGLSSTHTVTGLVNGMVLKASGGINAVFAPLVTSDLPSGIDAINIASGLVSNIEFQYLDGVTSPIQNQFSNKADTDGYTVIVTTGNQDVSGFQNLDHVQLQFPVSSGKVYSILANLIISSNNNAGDAEFAFFVNAGLMDGKGTTQGITTGDAVQNLLLSSVGNSGTANIPVGCVSNINIPMSSQANFSFLVDTNTTFKLAFGSVVASGNRIVRTWKGSVLKWKQLN